MRLITCTVIGLWAEIKIIISIILYTDFIYFRCQLKENEVDSLVFIMPAMIDLHLSMPILIWIEKSGNLF